MGFAYTYEEDKYITKDDALTLFRALGIGQSEQVLRRYARQGVFKTLDIHPKTKNSALGTGMIFEKESYYLFLERMFHVEVFANKKNENTLLMQSLRFADSTMGRFRKVDLNEIHGDFKLNELTFGMKEYGLKLPAFESDFFQKRVTLKAKKNEIYSEISKLQKEDSSSIDKIRMLKREVTEIDKALTKGLITERKKNKTLLSEIIKKENLLEILSSLHKEENFPKILLKRTELHFERILDFYSDEFYRESFKMLESIINYVFSFELYLWNKHLPRDFFLEIIRFDSLIHELLHEMKYAKTDVYDKHAALDKFDLKTFLDECNEHKIWRNED